MLVVLLPTLNDSMPSKTLNLCFILALELRPCVCVKKVKRVILEIGHTKSENKFAKNSCQRFIYVFVLVFLELGVEIPFILSLLSDIQPRLSNLRRYRFISLALLRRFHGNLRIALSKDQHLPSITYLSIRY